MRDSLASVLIPAELGRSGAAGRSRSKGTAPVGIRVIDEPAFFVYQSSDDLRAVPRPRIGAGSVIELTFLAARNPIITAVRPGG
ncbi:MAG: hypothetical protein ACLQJR_16420 [Stellaceae bacterium]